MVVVPEGAAAATGPGPDRTRGDPQVKQKEAVKVQAGHRVRALSVWSSRGRCLSCFISAVFAA